MIIAFMVMGYAFLVLHSAVQGLEGEGLTKELTHYLR